MVKRRARLRRRNKKAALRSETVAANRNTTSLHLYLSGRRRNASIKLLMLDYLSQRLLEHGRWLIGAAKDVSDEDIIATADQHVTTVDDSSVRGIELIRPSRKVRLVQERFHTMTPLTRLTSAVVNGRRKWHLPGLRGRHGHYFLDGYMRSRHDLQSLDKKLYFSIHASVEKEIMRLFKINLPVAGQVAHDCVDAEEKLVEDYSEYVRATEYAIHKLCQKPTFYSHLLFILILVFTRNLRRILRSHEPSIMLVEFTLLCAEAIHLTQKFLHQFCVVVYGNNASRLGIAVENLTNPDATSEHYNLREIVFLRNSKTLTSLNDGCGDYREAIVGLCRSTWKNYCRGIDYEVSIPSNAYSIPLSQGYTPITQSTSSSGAISISESYANSVEASPNAREGRDDGKRITGCCTTLCDFKLKADRLLCQWSIALCNYASEANKIVMGPLYAELHAVDVGKTTGGPVVLYKQVKGANLSLHRDPLLMDAIRSEQILTGENKRRSQLGALHEECTSSPSQNACDQGLQEMPETSATAEQVAEEPAYMEPRSSVEDPDLVVDESGQPATTDQASESLIAAAAIPPPSLTVVVNQDDAYASPSATKEANIPDAQSQVIPTSTSRDDSLPGDTTSDKVAVPDSGYNGGSYSSVAPEPRIRRNRKWNREDVVKLVDAINRHGAGKWAFFSYTYFGGKKTGLQLKDKWCNLTRYKHVYQVQVASGHGGTRKTCWKIVDTL